MTINPVNAENLCVICFENVTSEQKEDEKTLICNHLFHRQCIDQWLMQKESCPICRTRVTVNNNPEDMIEVQEAPNSQPQEESSNSPDGMTITQFFRFHFPDRMP